MSHAKHDLRFSGGKCHWPGRTVGLAVWRAISITGDRAIFRVAYAQSHWRIGRFGFLGPTKALRADVIVTAGHPLSRVAFAKDNRIEDATIGRLNADRRAPCL